MNHMIMEYIYNEWIMGLVGKRIYNEWIMELAGKMTFFQRSLKLKIFI